MMNSVLLTVASMTFATPTSPPPAPVTTLPPIVRLDLPNGLEVLLLENHQNPFVEAHLLFRAGTSVDPPGKEGLTSLGAELLTCGTDDMTEEEVARALEDLGAQLYASASVEMVELVGSVTTLEPHYVESFLRLFLDAARNAAFPDVSVARHRTLRQSAIQRLADDHSDLADRAFAEALYGTGPRGRPTSGYTKTIAGLVRADFHDWKARVLVPSHAVLALAGDFDSTAIERWARENLGDEAWGKGVCVAGDVPGRCAKLCRDGDCWENPFGRKDRKDPAPAAGARRVVLVDRDDPGMNQIQWRLGMDNPVGALHPQWPPFRLGTQVLGGDFTSRLNQVLRVREGLTYGARLNVDYGAEDSGPLVIATYVAPKDLAKAIDLTLAEIESVTKAPLPEAEVEGFKDKIINGFPFKFETVSDTLEQYLFLAAEGIPTRWLEDYRANLRKPTPAEIAESLAVLDPDRMVLVAVGNRDLVPVLEKYGKVEVHAATDFLARGLSAGTGE